MITTNLVVSVLMLTNGVAVGSQKMELLPVWGQRRIVCDYCKAYANYLETKEEYRYLLLSIDPPKGECHCKFVPTKIENYELVPFVEKKRKGCEK